MCNQIETREHLIWGCGWVKKVWDDLLGIKDTGAGCDTIDVWMKKRLQEQSGYKDDKVTHMES